jgi:hypothetical protein
VTTTSLAGYNFVVLSGGALLWLFNSSITNLSFSLGGFINAAGECTLEAGNVNVSTLLTTQQSSNGVFFNSGSTSSLQIIINIESITFTNVSTPYAVKGGLINVVKTVSRIFVNSLSGLRLLVLFLFIFSFFFFFFLFFYCFVFVLD